MNNYFKTFAGVACFIVDQTFIIFNNNSIKELKINIIQENYIFKFNKKSISTFDIWILNRSIKNFIKNKDWSCNFNLFQKQLNKRIDANG